ncbi:MAG TPA: hotdog fold thioesterase [Pseudomonadales bacterium]|jgi:uncharacterized protein (TIGR00369 family)|nr:hotdog fold thioesterase [Pseudomonadales bacterium]HMW15382.1 hotdog fold thioesterase [Pseudomonadales bacterium]HMY97284.1 hotdog fold thioesterase [Pseudomonadales bacterium]HMZ91988.1 hotdog fold thioesterase [Pseudomonadales bacterium]HNC77283.1 hotdog fold thioesterase [Pseudomonadales bacterium]
MTTATQSHQTATALLDFYANNGWANRVGIQLLEATPAAVSLFLGYDERNLNAPGGVVHGGVIGTLIHDAGQLLSKLHFAQTPIRQIRPLDIQINYMIGAKEADLTATATLIRATRALAFIDVEVQNQNRQCVARAHTLFRIAPADEEAVELDSALLHELAVKSPLALNQIGEMIKGNVARHAEGLQVLGLDQSRVRFTLDDLASNRDHEGALAGGAVLLLLDDAGVFCSFGQIQRGRAATVDLKVNFCQSLADEQVIAFGHCLKRQSEAITNQVLLFGASSGRLGAIGTMTFWGS